MALEPGKELLWKYAFGQCDAAEIAFVENWLKENPENQKELERIQFYQSIQDSENGSGMKAMEKRGEITEDKPYKAYVLPLLIIILVFILLFIYSLIKK